MTLKNNLQFILNKNEITLKVFAKKIDINYPKAVSYLNGTQMKLDLLVLISEKFNVSVDALLKTDLSTAENLPDHVGKFGMLEEYVIKVPAREKNAIYLEKNGVSFSVSEVADFVSNNQEEFMKIRAFSSLIELRVAKKIAEVSLNKEELIKFLKS